MKQGSKILYASFDRTPAPKGASVHITQFVRELALRHEVALMTPGVPSDDNGESEARRVIVEVEGKNFLADTVTFGEAVALEISSGEYDAVHVRSIWEGWPAVELKDKLGYKLVYEVNGLPSVELRYHYPSVSKNKELIERFKFMEARVLLQADRVIVPSTVTKNYIVGRGILPGKITVIPNGVDTDLFSPAAKKPLLPIKLIYIGTLAPWQGISHLLDAIKRASKTVEIKLVVVGKWRKYWLKELRKKARKLKIADSVEFIEPVRHREMPNLIRSAHIGVAPFPATERNTKQGFCPIKVIEYMACGLPVITSDIEAARELVADGAEGLLYKANSTARLSDAIVSLASNAKLRERLGKNGRARSEKLSWKASRAALKKLYASLK